MGARRIRREQRQVDMRESRQRNGVLKVKERKRRLDRIVEMIKKQGKLPYTPVVASYLSQELQKPTRLITQEDVDKFLSLHK